MTQTFRYGNKYLILLMLVTFGCAGAGNSSTASKNDIPAWAKTGKHPGYPQGMYWTGVGTGADIKTASDQARTEVAAQLKVQIKNSTTTIEQEFTREDRSFYSNAFNSTTQTLVDQTIQGIEIVESKQADGGYYVYAVLDRNQYLSSLEQELDDHGNRLKTLFQDAESLLDQGKVFPAIENFTDALELVPQVYPRQSFYNALADMKYTLPNNLTGPGLLSRVRTVLSNVQMTIASGADQSAAPGQPLPKSILVKVVLRREGGLVPIGGMPLRVIYESGELAKKTMTAYDGVASIDISAVAGSRAGQGAVIITPNLGRLPDIMAPQLKHLSLTVNYKVVGAAPAFSIVIKGQNGKRLNDVERDLSKAVIKAGFRVSETAPLRIEGAVKLGATREINMGGRPSYQTEAILSLIVVEVSSGVQKAALEVSKKTVNTSKSKAEAAAIGDVGGRVKRRQLTEMLGAALAK